jgi:hypothetical protein
MGIAFHEGHAAEHVTWDVLCRGSCGCLARRRGVSNVIRYRANTCALKKSDENVSAETEMQSGAERSVLYKVEKGRAWRLT